MIPKFVDDCVLPEPIEEESCLSVRSGYIPKYVYSEVDSDPIIICPPFYKTAQGEIPSLEQMVTRKVMSPQAPSYSEAPEWEYGKVYKPGEEQPVRKKKIPLDPEVWEALYTEQPERFEPIPGLRFTLRQKIKLAGQYTKMIGLTYIKADKTNSGEEGMMKYYELEPYSYRRKVTKVRGGRREYFFGYDPNDGTIKAFLVSGMKYVKILPRTFEPRWEVEVVYF